MRKSFLFILIFFALAFCAAAQDDSTTKVNNGKEVLLDTLHPANDTATVQLAKKDSVSKKQHDPRKATLRSAIIPGWGQAYNHEWWKIPIVYGAIGTSLYFYIDNNKKYHNYRDAYKQRLLGLPTQYDYPKNNNRRLKKIF